MNCKIDYIAVFAFAALASAIGGLRRIEVKPGWTEPSTVFIAVVGDQARRRVRAPSCHRAGLSTPRRGIGPASPTHQETEEQEAQGESQEPDEGQKGEQPKEKSKRAKRKAAAESHRPSS